MCSAFRISLTRGDEIIDESVDVCFPDSEFLGHDQIAIFTPSKFYITFRSKLLGE